MKKYLIIRFSSIGDIVLTTPVIRCLKKQTEAEVHFLTKKGFQSIVEPNPYVDKVYAIEKGMSEVLSDLKKEKYNAIIELHNNLRTQQVKWTLGAQSYAFDKINWQKWLMVNLKINRLPETHIVDRYLKTVAPLGVENDGDGLDFFLSENDEFYFKSISRKGVKVNFEKPFIALAIGAAHQTKRMPSELLEDICRKANLPIVLLGGPAEADEGAQLAATFAERQIINACGKISLQESAFLAKHATKVITPDTGMMHIAAAFQKEIISVWGNTIPEFGMSPYYGNHPVRNQTFEVKNLSCRPCSKIGHAKCPKGHFKCMRNQDVEGIINAVNTPSVT